MDKQRSKHYPLRRREVVEELLKDRGDMLVVAGLGACAWDVTAAGDHPLNFPLWGAMGGGCCHRPRVGAGATKTARSGDHG